MSEPAVGLKAYHISAGNNFPIHRVVIHTTESASSAAGSALGVAHYFQQGNSGGSAQYIEDAGSEQHCVADNQIAQHAPPNTHSIGIEICGRAAYTRAQWMTGDPHAALTKAAERCAELCARFHIPIRKLSIQDLLNGAQGVCGHVDVAQAFHLTTHTDPGAGFPWDVFLALVNGGTAPTPAPIPQPPQQPTFPTWEFQEAEVKSTLVQVGPLDDNGRGFVDWNPGLGRDPIPVGAIKQGPDPSPGSPDTKSGDPYWDKQGNFAVKASPRGGLLRVVVTGGAKGTTVGIYVSVA